MTAYLSPPSVKPPDTPTAPLPKLDPPILELHGTLRHAHCLSCHAPTGRDAFQDRLSELNPAWHEFQRDVEAGKREEKLNPDGDIELGPGVKYEDFVVPACDHCGGPMKPVRPSRLMLHVQAAQRLKNAQDLTVCVLRSHSASSFSVNRSNRSQGATRNISSKNRRNSSARAPRLRPSRRIAWSVK